MKNGTSAGTTNDQQPTMKTKKPINIETIDFMKTVGLVLPLEGKATLTRREAFNELRLVLATEQVMGRKLTDDEWSNVTGNHPVEVIRAPRLSNRLIVAIAEINAERLCGNAEWPNDHL